MDHNMKIYNIMHGIGKAKYLINYHDGIKTHDDGSPFYNVAIFKNKKKLNKFLNNLNDSGYRCE